MLTYLHIKNFALIESLELELGPGLTILSGETGAGKSIILAAVNLLLGGRAGADLIRAGEDQALVEAQFSLPPESSLWAKMRDLGLEPDINEGVISLRREVSREGRNRARVDGALSSLAILNELGPELLSICGQHAHQTLLNSEEHLNLLDAFAQKPAEELSRAVGEVFRLDQELAQAARSLAGREERRAWLEDAVRELEEADLRPDEEEALKQERKILANAGQIAQLAGAAYEGLYGAEEGTVLEILGRVRSLLNELNRLDQGAADMADRLAEAYFTLEDLASELRRKAETTRQDPQRLDQLESRLLLLQRLSRKYGGSLDSALERLEEARRELRNLSGGENRMEALEQARRQALETASRLAGDLSQARREQAPRLTAGLEEQLRDLGLASCRLEMRFSPPSGPVLDTPQGPLSRRGLEQGEFYLAPNPGEGFRPLARIASGGELSRLLLAMRGLTALGQGAATLIFDEVDAGIGGDIGAAVGRKLKNLAKSHQVLCITHLPQIAAYARTHLTVKKEERQGRTLTVLQVLDQEERVTELARMLSGEMGGSAAREHALALIQASREILPE